MENPIIIQVTTLRDTSRHFAPKLENHTMDTPQLFPLKITPELFGGKLFWDCLLDIGLLSKCCPVCGKEVPVVSYQSKISFPTFSVRPTSAEAA